MSIYMLVYALDVSRERSYARVAETLFGPRVSLFVDVAVVIQVLGTLVSYIVIIGDLLPPFMKAMSAPEFLQDRAECLTFVYLVFILPICCMRHLENLRYVSLVCLLIIGLLAALLVGIGSGLLSRTNGIDTSVPPHLLPASASALIRQVPVMFFAFICQMNIPILYGELRRQRHEAVDSKFKTKRSKMMAGVCVGMLIVTLVYELCGIFGHLAFRDGTETDVLKNLAFDQGGPFLAPYVKSAYSLAIVCSFPVMAFSGVESVHALLWHVRFAVQRLWRGHHSVGDGYMEAPASPYEGLFASPGDLFSPMSTMSPPGSPVTPCSPLPPMPVVDEEDRGLSIVMLEQDRHHQEQPLPTSGNFQASGGNARVKHTDIFGPRYQLAGEEFLREQRTYMKLPGKRVPPAGMVLRFLEVITFTGLSFALGVLCPDLSVALGLTGSISSSAIMYILPGAFFFRVKHDEGSVLGKGVGLTFVLFGVFASIICTTTVLSSLFGFAI
eukprot:CAMPEP_0194514048 /NCGR_PEP_ID=MMETSP0253-20130528/46380_1 /TAXON_ID=2966 /ORGANISM="Noctiluca scintillans" /LENGTH=497 /DNA_ID=CAMNT_0039357653 /DNA_START=287 /DNA_END=1780 /DNA_ORIENTATION=-